MRVLYCAFWAKLELHHPSVRIACLKGGLGSGGRLTTLPLPPKAMAWIFQLQRVTGFVGLQPLPPQAHVLSCGDLGIFAEGEAMKSSILILI